jgi:hypothetical protein
MYMISRTKKNHNRLKHSMRQTGGITLMEGKYAFFFNKIKYEELFGKPIIGEKAPSIKDITNKFHLLGYYIKNNTNTFHLIGWDNLTDEEKKNKLKDYDERVKSFGNFLYTFRRYNANKDWVSGNPEITTITSINLDDLDNVQQHLKNQFNYDRIIPSNNYYLRQEQIVEYTNHISWYPSVKDSYFCVIIQVNNLRPNKYLNFIENDIQIIKEQDYIDEQNKKRDEEEKRFIQKKESLLILKEKLQKLEKSPSYQKMLRELNKLKNRQNNFYRDLNRNVDGTTLKLKINNFQHKYNNLYKTILNKYKILIENEIDFNNENYIDEKLTKDKETLENLLKLKERFKHYLE